ncbi:hypothetical protein ABTE34_20920, partial [Acinetobacter baumannii]
EPQETDLENEKDDTWIEVFKAPQEKLSPIEEHPLNTETDASILPADLLTQSANDQAQSTLYLVLRLRTATNQLMKFSNIDDYNL